MFFGVCRVNFADFRVSDGDFGLTNVDFLVEIGEFGGNKGAFRVSFGSFQPKSIAYPLHLGHKRRKSNKGAGVPFYDSIATYDSGLLYDDPSSPQPNRRKMAKVKLGLSRLTPDELVDLANTIKTAMTGNANFTTPKASLIPAQGNALGS